MRFSLERLARYRPFLFHATRSENLASLRHSRLLCSTKYLKKNQKNIGLRGDREIAIWQGNKIYLGDHEPLSERNIIWEGGWTLNTLLEALDSRIFFFVSSTERIPKQCKSFVSRKLTRNIEMKILRIPTQILAVKGSGIEFCRYNSGAPRHWPSNGIGKPSPRGPNTFVDHSLVNFPISEIKEVTFLSSITLPRETRLYENDVWVDF